MTQQEPPAYTVVNPHGKSDVVLVCDHACNRISQQMQGLGLSAEVLTSHIAWDIGALWVAQSLAQRLDAPLVFSNYSRLVIDCNRRPERGDLIPASSAGIAIPGNKDLLVHESLKRRHSFFDPYHQAIEQLLNERRTSTALLLSIHSFTPNLVGQQRPWPIGVCYEQRGEMSERWRAALQKQLSTPVGDNEPYEVESDVDYTLPAHGAKFGVPSIMLEIRQDEISDAVAAQRWAEIIAVAWET